MSEVRQLQVFFKYPLLIERIKNGGKCSLIQGSECFNRYRQPFSHARWKYPWIEQFWIVLLGHVVSAREAARMMRALDSKTMGKISPKHIRDQIEPTIRFWNDFFEYVPHYLEFLNTMELFIRNDPELSKIDQRETEKYYSELEGNIEELVRTDLQRVLRYKSNSISVGGVTSVKLLTSQTESGFDFSRVTRVSKEMILVRHPNLNYQKEEQDFSKGLRKEKPKRKTSSCYFNPWKQPLDVIGQLIKKGKIHLR